MFRALELACPVCSVTGRLITGTVYAHRQGALPGDRQFAEDGAPYCYNVRDYETARA